MSEDLIPVHHGGLVIMFTKAEHEQLFGPITEPDIAALLTPTREEERPIGFLERAVRAREQTP